MSFSRHPAETASKGLCKTCLEMYDFSFCGRCTLKRDMDDLKFASKKYLPSLFLLPPGFIAFFILFSIIKPEPFYIRIAAGIIGSWGFGGIIWGWYFIGTLLGPNEYFFRTNRVPEISDMSIVVWMLFRILLSIIMGFIAMPVGLIKLIMAYFNIKKNSKIVKINEIESESVA